MTAQSASVLLRIAELRERSRAGTLTLEETKEAVMIMRQDRAAVSQPKAGTKARKAVAATKPSGDDLLSQLDDLP